MDELLAILWAISPLVIIVVLLMILREVRAIRMLSRGIATVAAGAAGSRAGTAGGVEDAAIRDRIRRTVERSGRTEAVLRLVEELGIDAATATRIVDEVTDRRVTDGG